MAHRPLGPDERALWARVIAGVRPLSPPPRPVPDRAVPDRPMPGRSAPDRAVPGRSAPGAPPQAAPPAPVPAQLAASDPAPAPARRKGRVPPPRAQPAPVAPRPPTPGTLDGGWDRRLRKGAHAPDRVIDLHEHTLGQAHAALDAALGEAVASGDRVLLIVAGRERREGARGGIRRSLGDWLAGSRHAGRIAAVRPAHPRHGGAGAVYLILRRAPAPRG